MTAKLLLTFLFAFFLFKEKVFSQVFTLFDIDGTITNDFDKDYAFRTPIVIERIDFKYPIRILKIGQKDYYTDPNGILTPIPKKLHIYNPEYLRNIGNFSHNNLINNILAAKLDDDPLYPKRQKVFIPGFYAITDQSYQYFKSEEGKKHLIQSYKDARKRMGFGFTLEGPAFTIFAHVLSSPSLLKSAYLYTMQGHEIEEYTSLFKLIKKDYGIKEVYDENSGTAPLNPSVFPMLNPKIGPLFGKNELERKINMHEHLLSEILYSPLPKHTEAFSQPIHTFITFENDPMYYQKIFHNLKSHSESPDKHDIKFVLFDARYNPKIKKTKIEAHRYTIFENGQARSAHPFEIKLWTGCEKKITGTPIHETTIN